MKTAKEIYATICEIDTEIYGLEQKLSMLKRQKREHCDNIAEIAIRGEWNEKNNCIVVD